MVFGKVLIAIGIPGMGQGELASSEIQQSIIGSTNVSMVVPDNSAGDLLHVCLEAEGSTCEEGITYRK